MGVGNMTERITLQAPSKTSSGLGASDTTTWTDVGTPIWAEQWTVSSSESSDNKQTSLVRIQKFKIRFRSVLKASWRIKWGNRYFNITGNDPDKKREFIFLTCKEIG